jgi:uncharacterized damage-inducible protein DinB
MLDRDYVRLMAEYNAWMNDKLYAACAQLDDEERKRDRGVFFKSIHGTLNHLMWGDRAFLRGLLGWDVKVGKPADTLFDDFAALRAERKRYDEALLAWARAFEEGKLSERYAAYNVVYERRRRMPRYMMMVQMFNHQTHHRGQLTALLTQLGIDVGSTDVPALPYTDEICDELPV